MDQPALDNSSASATDTQTCAPHRESRGFWVLTAYGLSGLMLFGVLVYYFSTYVTR